MLIGEWMMMASDFIVDVDESSFEYEVLSYSKNVPVVVEFWATWCRPCKVLGPMLEAMAKEANGAFRLARIDTDQNPNLALQFGVRTIPTVKAISGGQVVGEFAGILPEERLREFLEKITPPSPMQLLVEKAASLLSLHQFAESEKIYRQLLEQSADQPASLLGLSKALLAQNKASEALGILRNFPASRLYSTVELLLPYAQDLVDYGRNQLSEESELDAAYRTAIRLA